MVVRTFISLFLRSLVRMLALGAGHKGTLLGALDHLWTAPPPHEAAVLEEALVPREAVGKVLESQQSQAPDLTATKFSLVLHAIGAPKYPIAMEPSLMELAFVSTLENVEWFMYRKVRVY